MSYRAVNRPPMDELVRMCYVSGTRYRTAEHYNVCPKTISYWLRFYGNPVTWRVGRPRKIVYGTLSDSDRKLVEQLRDLKAVEVAEKFEVSEDMVLGVWRQMIQEGRW